MKFGRIEIHISKRHDEFSPIIDIRFVSPIWVVGHL